MNDQGSGEPGDASAPASGVGAPADLGTRFLARLIDFVLLGIVNAIIFAAVITTIFTTSGGFGGAFYGGFQAGTFLYGIIAAAIDVGYFTFMESSRGQTVGKMLLGIRTEGPDGNLPPVDMAFKRNVWIALSIVPIIGGLAELAIAIYIAVTINQSPEHIGWHDTFAGGTRVIRVK